MADISARLKALGVATAVDCHLHPWSKSNLPAVIRAAEKVRPDLVKDYSPSTVVQTAKSNGFSGVIFVHARDPEDDSLGETHYFLDAAHEMKGVAGAVVGIDLLDPSGTEKRLSALLSDPALKGARMIRPENTGVGILGDSRCKETTKLLGDMNLSFDLLLRCSNEGQLAEGVRLVEWLAEHSQTRVIGDHLLKPLGISDGRPRKEWLQALDSLAECPNFFLKISGLPGEVPPGTSSKVFHPFYDAALQALGASRLLFGSDHPVSYSHDGAVAAVLDWLEPQGPRSQELSKAIFQDNALSAYNLKVAG